MRSGRQAFASVEVVEEYKERTNSFDELDLLREAAKMGSKFKRNFQDSESLYVPHFYSETLS